MARTVKKGLKYFNIDCIQEDNLNYVEAKHGIIGYGVLVKLWRKIYMVEGYFTDWHEKNIYLFAREISVDVDKIKEVVESCFEEKIFDREMFQKHNILTSSGIQKRYIKIVREAKKKDCEIDDNYSLLSIIPEKSQILPEETAKIRGESTQRKEKERKLKENTVVPEKPAQPKKVSTEKIKKEDPPEPYWDMLVSVWFDFGIQKFEEKPSFAGQDPKIFKRIIHLLKNRAGDKWNEESAVKRLKSFLEMAFSEKWLSENFLLSNLEKQFDKIIQKQSDKKKLTPVRDIDYLYERFLDGQLDHRLILPSHFEDLKHKGLVSITEEVIAIRKASLIGGNNATETALYQDYEAHKRSKLVIDDLPNLQRIAVVEYFKQCKNKKLSAVG